MARPKRQPDAEQNPDPYGIGAKRPSELAHGTRVLYYPVLPREKFTEPSLQPRETKTRSVPWQLGHGEWVVLIEGKTGGVSTQHLEPLP